MGSRPYLTTAVCVCSWLYLLAVLLVWCLLRFAGDRWWFATLMLFGPRSVYAAPLALLAPAALALRRRSLWPLAVSALIVAGPVMGLCLPWARCWAPAGPTIRVLTCNLKGCCTDNERFNALLRETSPDVVALQGCWGDVGVAWPAGWHVRRQGEILIASRYPLRDAAWEPGDTPSSPSAQAKVLRCAVASPLGDFRVLALHLPSIHDGISRVLDGSTGIRPSKRAAMVAEIASRRRASEEVSRWMNPLSVPLIVAGDFNMPTHSTIYQDCWAGLSNAFSEAGFGYGYTEQPTIRGWRLGIRIDHILTGPGWRPRRCWVGPAVGSDHLPLIADLRWQGG